MFNKFGIIYTSAIFFLDWTCFMIFSRTFLQKYMNKCMALKLPECFVANQSPQNAFMATHVDLLKCKIYVYTCVSSISTSKSSTVEGKGGVCPLTSKRHSAYPFSSVSNLQDLSLLLVLSHHLCPLYSSVYLELNFGFR